MAMTEFLPDRKLSAVQRFVKQIDREMNRRIQAKFPLQEQNFMIVSLLAQIIGIEGSTEIKGVSSEEYLFARDRVKVRGFIACVIRHRHAAEALQERVNSNKQLVNEIDLTEDKWWESAGAEHDDTKR